MSMKKMNKMVAHMIKQLSLLMIILLGVTSISANTQAMENHQDSHMGHDLKQMPVQTMDEQEMQHMDHGGMKKDDKNTGHTMKQDSPMTEMKHGSMQGGSAPEDARDPHAYSGGYDFGPIAKPKLADEHSFSSLLVDRLEVVRNSENTAASYDAQAWYGRDYDRVVLKAEGEYDNKELEEASTELLWGHAIAAYWDSQLGLRYDSGEGPDRAWLALGVQGLSPYWFEVDASLYLGEEGRTALSIEAEYELLLTQRLILQPRIEMTLYGKKDNELGRGKGLSELAAGIRLRYEFRRELAPYVGVEWVGLFGDTADIASDAGESDSETMAVAGLRFWF